MGGNALKYLNPIRVSSEEAFRLYWTVNSVVNIHGGSSYIIPWCLDKKNHGDVDILISDIDVIKVADLLNVPYENRHSNGPVLSVGIKCGDGIAQVDLITVDKKHVNHTLLYYSGGGLGMMIGRVAAWHGYTFAQEGLRLRATQEPWSEDILLTNDPKKSLEFLGYDITKHKAFNNELECWEFALSSDMARPFMFAAELNTAENRNRDKKRPSFLRFYEWLSKLDQKCDHQQPERIDSINRAATFFNIDLNKIIEDQENKWKLSKSVNEVFGSASVKAVFPGISDEDMGNIIRRIQKFLPKKESRQNLYTDNSVIDYVKQVIKYEGERYFNDKAKVS